MARGGLEPPTPRFSAVAPADRPAVRILAESPSLQVFHIGCSEAERSPSLPRYPKLPADTGGLCRGWGSGGTNLRRRSRRDGERRTRTADTSIFRGWATKTTRHAEPNKKARVYWRFGLLPAAAAGRAPRGDTYRYPKMPRGVWADERGPSAQTKRRPPAEHKVWGPSPQGGPTRCKADAPSPAAIGIFGQACWHPLESFGMIRLDQRVGLRLLVCVRSFPPGEA